MSSNYKKPLVAVMLCVYKGDNINYFSQAVNSLKVQTYGSENIKIFLGIDGILSSDLEEYIEFNKSQFHYIYQSPENIGLASMLNILIKDACKFPYAARMDADDVSKPNRITKQIEYLQNNKEIGILGTGITEFNEDGIIGERSYPQRDRIHGSIGRGSPLAHPTVMYTGSALQLLNSYPIVHGNEDIAMWFKALKYGILIDNLQESFLNFRVSRNTFKRRGPKKALGEFKTYVNGIYDLRLGKHLLIFPILRLIYRLSPTFISRWFFYATKFRNIVLS